MAKPSATTVQSQASSYQTSWSVAQHDTIPAVDLWLNPLDTHTYLFAFLRADGEQFLPPYGPVRDAVTQIVSDAASRERKGQAPSGDVSNQRLRTWKSVFESFGLLLVDETSRIRLSPLGRALNTLYSQIDDKIEGANDHIAKLAVGVLNRQTLRNPLDGTNYPEDTDVRPFRFMWKAMRQLDDKLHWEEMNRVLMHVRYAKDEDAAIAHIREIRAASSGKYDSSNVDQLGTPAVSQGDETKRRVTPWLSRAGFGGLLISPNDDQAGYRHLKAKYKPLLDDALQTQIIIPPEALTSPAAYVRYITSEPGLGTSNITDQEQSEISRVVDAAIRYGNSKIICLSGLPATGKTYIAKLAASQLVSGDPYRYEETQFHPNTTYDDFIEGFVPKPSGDGFELRPKLFRVINRRARLDPNNSTYVLLIEEFSRADIHAVLGELLTYVEHRDRAFRLSTSQDEERVAPNLVIMATLNPRDKSAVILDQAIIRRLHRVDFTPSAPVLRSMLESQLDAAVLEQLASWFEKFLSVLPFGHGVFAGVKSEQDLRDTWNGTIRYYLTDVAGDILDIYRDAATEFPWK